MERGPTVVQPNILRTNAKVTCWPVTKINEPRRGEQLSAGNLAVRV